MGSAFLKKYQDEDYASITRQVNSKDEVGKAIKVKRDDAWVRAEIVETVEIVDDTGKEKVTVRYEDDDEQSKGIEVSVDKTRVWRDLSAQSQEDRLKRWSCTVARSKKRKEQGAPLIRRSQYLRQELAQYVLIGIKREPCKRTLSCRANVDCSPTDD